ncbi:MAG: Holliday junction resolvase RuvX [Saprospiraceae bacterium]|nr:Holliday junction resolvase RuvX [Saprospiraceae bacterium]
MGRLLAIDYGEKRCGIAVTDPLRIIAAGLTTVDEPSLLAFLKTYLASEQVDAIVLGLPVDERGVEGPIAEKVRKKAAEIVRAFPLVKVDFWDERYTSRMAKAVILASGLKKMQRRDKARVDKVSAGLILQEYLEHTEKEKQV